jgi:hypothetical protein
MWWSSLWFDYRVTYWGVGDACARWITDPEHMMPPNGSELLILPPNPWREDYP